MYYNVSAELQFGCFEKINFLTELEGVNAHRGNWFGISINHRLSKTFTGAPVPAKLIHTITPTELLLSDLL